MRASGRGAFDSFARCARGIAVGWLIIGAVAPANAAKDDFIGSWLFYIDHRPAGFAYGTLDIEAAGDGVAAFIDGGPSAVAIDGDRITLIFDWDNGGGIVSVSELSGSLGDDGIEGVVRHEGEPTGTWRATPRLGPPGFGEPPSPVDLGGTWQMRTTDGSGKESFAMTPEAGAFRQAFMPQYDDPVLRCVSDGLVRVTGGPFAKEILHQDGRITILYEDMHEIRRVYLNGEFPEDVEFLDSPLGYSIGHWEGSTLVIETRGLQPALWHRAGGKPISAEAHITEYIYRGDDGNLHVELVLDDPVNYERAPLRHTVFAPTPDYEFSYYACDPDAFYRALYLEEQLELYFGRSQYRR